MLFHSCDTADSESTCSNTCNTTGACSPGHGCSPPLTTDAHKSPVSLIKSTKLMEDQCLFSQSSAISTAEFVLKWPEEARGHLPLVPSSVGLLRLMCLGGKESPGGGTQLVLMTPTPPRRACTPCPPTQ